ncbi:alpha/beta hydrolase [Nonomuraea sp. NPDC050556]|uniref:alpha/beta hydrolase n=1 Tax=Nonomuraea sp. NPDC050556 TaxID=3364369 RepID=UPI0037873233
MKKTLATALLGVITLSACAAEPPKPVRSTVAWATCTDLIGPDTKPVPADPSVECGKLAVPLDYAKPDGEKIELALVRVKATGDRLGSLVFNFGGPGGGGVDTLAMARRAFASLGTRYDLVSFDPRGVDRSAPVTCGGDLDKYLNADLNDDAMAKDFAETCGKKSGKLLPHVGTVNATHDLDRIRAALGEETLNYFGMSYGTHLGAFYATKYPKKVGRFVLDAAIDPTVTFEERALIQVGGFKHAFEAFAKDCVAQGCDLGANEAAVLGTVQRLLKTVDSKPVKVGGRELTYTMAQTGVLAALYAKAAWPVLEQSVAAALKGDGSGLLSMADMYMGRRPDGSYTTLMTSVWAINCVDNVERPSAAVVDQVEEQTRKLFPVMASGGLGSVCRHWPVAGSDEAKKIDASGSAPIVVVGGKGDPATPYEWAGKLTAQLKTGVLVTYEGEGHGAYLSGSACVMRLVDTYLLTGKLPPTNSDCPAA